MNKKVLVIIVAVIAIIGISSVAGYLWYNAQFDDNLVKASGYQKLGLKSINDDFTSEWQQIDQYINNKEVLKSKVNALQKYLDEDNEARKNMENSLNAAKNFAKNDVEKEYIDLLLKKNKLNKDVNDNKQKMVDSLKDYSEGKITYSELYNKIMNLYTFDISSEHQDVNNKIMKLLINNPEFKQHLKDLDVDKTFLGEKPD